MSTIAREIRRQSTVSPDRFAIYAPGRAPLTYAALNAQCERTRSWLTAAGVLATDTVALLLPNGPEMATAFLGVASAAVCAPLNPAYVRKELEFYFEDLRPKALLTQRGLNPAAENLANERGLPCIWLRSDPTQPAGAFDVDQDPGGAVGAECPRTNADSVALVLHTSGTTSRPKLVPLTHGNLLCSGNNIGRCLRLAETDRCLNVMPLFHIHGLVGALLSSILSGAAVICSLGVDPEQTLLLLEDGAATWLTAVPTVYQSLAAHAARRGVQPRAGRFGGLRFLRSSSASLPPQLMATLEDIFGVPVIEAYGMTEASHQMASNPLPPMARKPGSVGPAAGPEVMIMANDGEPVADGEIGEVVIRGPSVTRGYTGNEQANEAAFQHSWFRTGDQGRFDEDGYLFISGRLKELINRGGEKISPREIEEALLAHADVAEAVTFAAPHPTLGEDVVAAVVLRPGRDLQEGELHDFVRGHLAPFKVPARILFVPELPKGPTGKLQRIGLADKLSHLLNAGYVAPRDDTERALAEIWSDVLGIDRMGVADNFFSSGGDSIQAVRMAGRATRAGLSLSVETLQRYPTIQELAKRVLRRARVKLNAEAVPGDVPLYGFQHAILHPDVLSPAHYTSPSEVVFRAPATCGTAAARAALRNVVRHHDALNLRFERAGAAWHQIHEPLDHGAELPLTELQEDECVNRAAGALHRSAQLDRAPLLRALFVPGKTRAQIVLVAHHLVADAYSMRVLAEDFAESYEQAIRGRAAALPAVETPFSSFCRRYDELVRSKAFDADLHYWLERDRLLSDAPRIVRRTSERICVSDLRHLSLPLGEIPPNLSQGRTLATIGEAVLAALSAALRSVCESRWVRLLVMMSGRALADFGDTSRTVGCFANPVPLVLDLADRDESGELLAAVQRQFAALPRGGASVPALANHPEASTRLEFFSLFSSSQAFFNYKGRLGPRSAHLSTAGRLESAPCTYPPAAMISQLRAPDDLLPDPFRLQFHFEVAAGKLHGDCFYVPRLVGEQVLQAIGRRMSHVLKQLL